MGVELRGGDALVEMASLEAGSVDLIATDPPYFEVKDEAWDHQWKSPAAFVEWIGRLCEQWQRILKPNGSLYVFASPRMAARVECKIAEHFEVLNQIVWTKPNDPGFDGWRQKCSKEALRQWYPHSERIVFAEHFGSDRIAKGEAGYAAKCDELRGFVFEPIRAYLDGERRRAGVSHREVIARLGLTGHDSHFFSPVQWKLPLAEQYESMRQLFNFRGGVHLAREHEHLSREYDFLKQEYEKLRLEYEVLRQQYEDLRRPFAVDASIPYTDVWDFPTVRQSPGKHPCEKPLAMMEHIVSASSRPGDLVLDCFLGSGPTALACANLGRRCVGIDSDPHWVEYARRRVELGDRSLSPLPRKDRKAESRPLFDNLMASETLSCKGAAL